MIDQAGIRIAQGSSIACERICGVNDNMCKSHYHDYFEVYYLETGERWHRIRDQLCKIKAGEFILFPPYLMHHSYGDTDVPFTRLLVYFHREDLNSAQVLTALERAGGIYRPDQRAGREIHRIMETLLAEQEHPTDFHDDAMHTLVNLLALTLLKLDQIPLPNESRGRIDKVIHYIHTHYQEDLSIDALAQMFYISPYYLCREFKRHTNSTIVQYVNITRIMNAQRKFMETDKNITEISKETGFSNLTHFNRVFKSVAGMTPSEYRRSCHVQERR